MLFRSLLPLIVYVCFYNIKKIFYNIDTFLHTCCVFTRKKKNEKKLTWHEILKKRYINYILQSFFSRFTTVVAEMMVKIDFFVSNSDRKFKI